MKINFWTGNNIPALSFRSGNRYQAYIGCSYEYLPTRDWNSNYATLMLGSQIDNAQYQTTFYQKRSGTVSGLASTGVYADSTTDTWYKPVNGTSCCRMELNSSRGSFQLHHSEPFTGAPGLVPFEGTIYSEWRLVRIDGTATETRIERLKVPEALPSNYTYVMVDTDDGRLFSLIPA